MPIRMLRDWTDSEAVNGLKPSAEVLFVRLIMKADDYGRFTANPKLIRSLCFPLRDDLRDPDIARDLAACEKAGLLVTYSASGKSFLEIRNFGQRLKHSRAKYPPPDGGDDDFPGTSRNFPELPGTSRNFPPEEKRREVEVETEVEHEHEHEKEPPDGDVRASGYSPAFEAWYATYPRHVGKESASRRFSSVLKKLAGEHGGRDAAYAWLMDRTAAFAKSPKGKGDYCPYPATWLNEGRYNDDDREWQRAGNAGGNRGSITAGPGQLYDPSSGGGGPASF